MEKLKYPINTIILLLIVLISGCGTDNILSPTNTSDAPTHLVAIAISKSEVELSWKDNSAVEDGFIVERKPGYQGTYQVIAKTGPDITLYRDKSLSLKPGTTYYYRVVYYKGSEISDYSNAYDATTLEKVLALNKSLGFLTFQRDFFDNDNEDGDSVTGIEDESVQTEKDIPWAKIVVMSTLFYGDNIETGLQIIPGLMESQIEKIKSIVSDVRHSLQLPGYTLTEPDIDPQLIEIILSADKQFMELLDTDQYTTLIKWVVDSYFLPQISAPPPE